MSYKLLPEVSIEGLNIVTARSLKALTELGLYNNDDVVKVSDVYQNKENLVKLIGIVFPPVSPETAKAINKQWEDVNLSEVLKGFRDFLLQLSLRELG